MSEKSRDPVDCFIDPKGRIRFVIPDLLAPYKCRVARIGGEDSEACLDGQIEVPVFIILDRLFETAREEHIVRFTPGHWDEIAKKTDKGCRITLKNAIVVYDDESEVKTASNATHLDFATPNGISGSDCGISREYHSGWVSDIDEVLVSTSVFQTDEEIELLGSLPTCEELMETARLEKERWLKELAQKDIDSADELF